MTQSQGQPKGYGKQAEGPKRGWHTAGTVQRETLVHQEQELLGPGHTPALHWLGDFGAQFPLL